jgi:hypothetical protein
MNVSIHHYTGDVYAVGFAVGAEPVVAAGHRSVSARICRSRGLRPPVETDLDPVAEKFFELAGESLQIEEWTAGFEVDEEVDVTGGGVVAGCDGAVEADAPPAVPSHGGLDFVAVGDETGPGG